MSSLNYRDYAAFGLFRAKSLNFYTLAKFRYGDGKLRV